ncbi:MAG TPA: IS110 family transposase [Actinomycetota bacterium]|nr:IS110 family transposase [Actinomycetota bacterium]
MKQLRDPVAGLDVHRDNVVAAVRTLADDGEASYVKRTFATTRRGVAALTAFLKEAEVVRVAIEATGVYWKPVYYPMEGLFPELWLCNAQHVKNVPGRKTDLADAEWLADVAAHGMVRPSFVPPPEIRELRELTRYRKTQITERGREIQRLEKVLQDAGIKITSVASHVWTLSGRRIVEALIAGERDPAKLAELALGRLRPRQGELIEALSGHFGSHHAVVCRQVIGHIDFLDASIEALGKEIGERMLPFESAVVLISAIPGIQEAAAQSIIGEIGVDMSRFPTAGHLCAWAGVAPASYESAGKKRPAGTRQGGRHLRKTLIECSRSVSRMRNTYFHALYGRIAKRRGSNKAAMAVAHSMLVAIWWTLTTGVVYEDPGADYYQRHIDPEREAKRLLSQIEALGFGRTHHPEGSRVGDPRSTKPQHCTSKATLSGREPNESRLRPVASGGIPAQNDLGRSLESQRRPRGRRAGGRLRRCERRSWQQKTAGGPSSCRR